MIAATVIAALCLPAEVLVDEGHRGAGAATWKGRRDQLCESDLPHPPLFEFVVETDCQLSCSQFKPCRGAVDKGACWD